MTLGVEQGILLFIKSLKETMGWTIEQAMAALRIPKFERQTHQDLLKKMLSLL